MATRLRACSCLVLLAPVMYLLFSQADMGYEAESLLGLGPGRLAVTEPPTLLATTGTTTWTASMFVLEPEDEPTTLRPPRLVSRPAVSFTPKRRKGVGEVGGDMKHAEQRSPPLIAEDVPNIQDSRVNANCKAPDPKTAGVIGRILCSEFKAQWNQCALVGGASDLQAKGLGPEIDAHDTVIRVNRVPTPKFFQDFGNRTDVLFAGPRAEGRAMYNLLGQFIRVMGGSYSLCEFSAGDCPFKALVLKGSDFPEYKQRWEQRYPMENPGWHPRKTKWPLGYQLDDINSFAYELLAGSRPTNGFHAFLTFLLICDKLDVYGFSGTGTADGHTISELHNVNVEHEMLELLSSGEPPSEVKGKKLDPGLLDRIKSRKGLVNIIKPEGR